MSSKDEDLLVFFDTMSPPERVQVFANLRALLLRRSIVRVYGQRCGALDEITRVFERNGMPEVAEGYT